MGDSTETLDKPTLHPAVLDLLRARGLNYNTLPPALKVLADCATSTRAEGTPIAALRYFLNEESAERLATERNLTADSISQNFDLASTADSTLRLADQVEEMSVDEIESSQASGKPITVETAKQVAAERLVKSFFTNTDYITDPKLRAEAERMAKNVARSTAIKDRLINKIGVDRNLIERLINRIGGKDYYRSTIRQITPSKS